MLRHLAKYAQASANLRELALEKRAGSIGSVVQGVGGAIKRVVGAGSSTYSNWAKNAKGVTGTIARHPVGAAMGVATAGLGTVGAVGAFKQNKAGFDPAVHQQMLGIPPRPPG